MSIPGESAIKMMKLSAEKRNRLILVILGSIVLGATIWYGVVRTRNAQIEQSVNKLAAAKDKLEKAQNRVKQAEQIEADMEEASRRLKTIEEGMAPGTDLFSWSYVLLDRARAGQELEVVEITRPQTNEVGVLPAFPYLAATFTVRGTAHYHDFGKFLADFENKFPYFYTQNLSLGTVPEAGLDAGAGRIVKDKLFFKMDIVALIRPAQ
jgi:Tfp pilus assembly protein PilO